MSSDGFYAVSYSGSADTGVAVIVLKDGVCAGIDIGGVQYDGTYTIGSAGEVALSVTVNVPAGGQLVTGVPAQSRPWQFLLSQTLPAKLGNGAAVQIDVQGAAVHASFKLLRGF